MPKPNFLIIGAAKAGTTAIHNYLRQHPEIYMSSVKEPMFFAFEGEKVNFRGSRSHNINNSITCIKDYESLFDGVTKEIAIGESSPIYLYNQKAPGRIHHHLPDAKIIAILRDPAERAYSHYLMLVRNGVEKPDKFMEALHNERSQIMNQFLPAIPYVGGGFYYSQLKRYFNLFDREQIKIYLYEDLRLDSQKLLKDIFGFIGVATAFSPDVSVKHNVSGVPKNRFIKTLMNQDNPLKLVAKSLLPQKFRKNIYSQINQLNMDKPTIPDEAKHCLQSIYKSEILNLQELIQRDLSAWLIK